MTMVAWSRVYLDALRSGDRRHALAVVEDARAAGLGLPALYLDVFQPALREIGRLWQENEVTVAEEHLATAITQVAMGRLYTDFCMAANRNGRTLLAACAERERHELGLRMICDLVELEGWDATYLGATVPQDTLVAMVLRDRPDVLALSTSLAPHLPQVRALIQEIRGQRTVVVSSHNLQELEELCDAAAILDRGALVQVGSMGQLTAQTSEFTVHVARGDVPLAEVRGVAGVTAAQLDPGGMLVVHFDEKRAPAEDVITHVVGLLAQRGVYLLGVQRGRKLEARVLELT